MADLISQGIIAENNGFYSFTDLAVKRDIINIPTIEEIEIAILDVFAERAMRPSEGEMAHEIQSNLWHKGFTGELCVAGFKSLIKKVYWKLAIMIC